MTGGEGVCVLGFGDKDTGVLGRERRGVKHLLPHRSGRCLCSLK